MTRVTIASVLLAAAAVACLVPPSPQRLLHHRLGPGGSPGVLRGRGAASGRRAVTALPGGDGVHRALSRARGGSRARAAVGRRRSEVIELCTALGTELRAGAMPVDALVSALRSVPGLCDEAGQVAALGGDTVSALRAAAGQPGAAGLARLAAAWAVTELTGTGLADGCERVGSWLRDEEALRREVSAQLAGARASGRMLTVLPLFGLALGVGIGGDPLAFLLGTPYGLGCLVGGTALVLTGLAWTERLARSVEAQI